MGYLFLLRLVNQQSILFSVLTSSRGHNPVEQAQNWSSIINTHWSSILLTIWTITANWLSHTAFSFVPSTVVICKFSPLLVFIFNQGNVCVETNSVVFTRMTRVQTLQSTVTSNKWAQGCQVLGERFRPETWKTCRIARSQIMQRFVTSSCCSGQSVSWFPN